MARLGSASSFDRKQEEPVSFLPGARYLRSALASLTRCFTSNRRALPGIPQLLREGAYEGDGYNFYSREDEAKTTPIGYTTGHCAALMASCQFTYLNREHVKLYSGVDFGLGVYFLNKQYYDGYTDSDGNAHDLQHIFLPAFNLTALGVSFGSERLYGLAELNLGYEAMLKLGIGCSL